jgi:tetratricopeptide (TPR) repeat protein
MNTATIKRFLMLLSSAKGLEREQLYQLIQKAESCYCLKDKGQYDLGLILKSFPPPFDLIGDYYQAFYLYRQGHRETAIEKLTTVREQGMPYYQAKSLLTFGAIHQVEGDVDEAMKVRLAASKSEILSITLDAAIGITALLGGQGKHDKAVEYLESVLPHASKLGDVPLQYDLYNSYATELAEIGKIEQAQKVIKPVLLSRYTPYYPNWPETAKEIQEKSSRRSMVTFNRSNVIYFPVREVETDQEIEETNSEETGPSFPHARFISDVFDIRDKVEDWIYSSTQPDDLTTLMLAIDETDDYLERSMIVEEVIDSTFPNTPEAKEAKQRWRDGLLAKMKEQMRPPEK